MGRYKKGVKRIGLTSTHLGTIKSRLFIISVMIMLLPLRALASSVVQLNVNDAITPPIASYISENIDYAIASGASAVIIQLDTPGGLDTAMRKIVKKEMNSNIPVVVYVGPKGARAASAGAIITIAADIAAMAPGTNIGAAHPVSIGTSGEKSGENKTMVEKVTNDAVAYVRSIARMRGRNEKWAEAAIRKSISTPAEEALKKGVVDLIANNLTDLLTKLDGRKVKKNSTTFVLKTKDATIVKRPMGFRYRLLSKISNPNVAYILMMIGLAGLYFELASPGAILPGVIGGISLILAFFAFNTLPVNYAGIALILLAIILFIAEIKVPSFGLLTVGGVISFILGSILLFRTPELYARVSMGVILPIAILFSAFFVICIYLVIKVHSRPAVTGMEGLIGEAAEVYIWNEQGNGQVFCHGEYWHAKGPGNLKPGDTVKVKDVKNLKLIVIPGEGNND